MNWLLNLLAKGPASGAWCGHYEQHGRTFPIEATLKHRGNKLSGNMLDTDGHHRQSLREMLEQSSVPEDEIEQFIDEIRLRFPELPHGEIEFRSYLPENSIIAGKLENYEVSFTKRYEGYHKIEYVLNDLALEDSVQCDTVQYTGVISPDFASIAGHWSIAPANEYETETTGTFQLNRQNDR